MGLLDDIIRSGVADQPPALKVVLRQCILLANELKVPLLRTWAEQELNGYPDPRTVPEYRTINAPAMGVFDRGFGMIFQRAIPASQMEPDHRWAAETVHLAEPVGSYESITDAQGRLRYRWLPDMIMFYQQRFIQDSVLTDAWQEVSKSAIIGVLDQIRTRVLTTAIDIKNGLGESVDFSHIKPDSPEARQAKQIVIANILGGTVHISGGDQVVNTKTNITVGNFDDLKKVLGRYGIDEKDTTELSQAIEKDGKPMGTGVKGWIERNGGKMVDGGVKMATAIGTTLLTEFLRKYYGLP